MEGDLVAEFTVFVQALAESLADLQLDFFRWSRRSQGLPERLIPNQPGDRGEGNEEELAGDDIILPCISAGATDSRFLREAGIPSYGISMMALNLDPAMSRSVHGKDEKIDIESLQLKTDFLVRVARRYLGN